MSRHRLLIISTACAAMALSACKQPEEPMLPRMDKAGQQASQAAEDKAAELGKAKDEFLGKSREEIEQLRARIDALEEKARTSGADMKEKLEKQVEELRGELGGVETKWESVKQAGAAAWQDAKAALSASIDKLKETLSRASEG